MAELRNNVVMIGINRRSTSGARNNSDPRRSPRGFGRRQRAARRASLKVMENKKYKRTALLRRPAVGILLNTQIYCFLQVWGYYIKIVALCGPCL